MTDVRPHEQIAALDRAGTGLPAGAASGRRGRRVAWAAFRAGPGLVWGLAAALLILTLDPRGAVQGEGPPPYPQSIEEDIRSLLAAGADQSSDPVFLLQLAELYLDAGDNLFTDRERRRRAYEEGAKAAWRAIEVQDLDPEAHYLYAANLGSAAQLKGVMASALTVRALLHHVERALELEPDHPGALHMLGMMREELPALLGGDAEQAVAYLERAVEVDPSYSHARLNLAKVYLDRGRVQDAETQLRAIVEMTSPRNRHAWRTRHKPEAQALLKERREE